MDAKYRMVACGICCRRWSQSRCERTTIDGTPGWLCEHCIAVIDTGETSVAAVRRRSEARGRK